MSRKNKERRSTMATKAKKKTLVQSIYNTDDYRLDRAPRGPASGIRASGMKVWPRGRPVQSIYNTDDYRLDRAPRGPARRPGRAPAGASAVFVLSPRDFSATDKAWSQGRSGATTWPAMLRPRGRVEEQLIRSQANNAARERIQHLRAFQASEQAARGQRKPTKREIELYLRRTRGR